MTHHRQRDLFVTGLAACTIGLLLSPYIYIAIGALQQFSPAFSFVTVPPLLLSTGILAWRLLAKPGQHRQGGVWVAIEVLSWMAIAAFVALISRFNLFTRFERVGLFCTVFLAASVICLPLVLLRDTSLEQRLRRLPSRAALTAFVLIVGLAGITTVVYVWAPASPHF